MRMLVAGEWTAGAQQEELRGPYSGEVIDTVPVADVRDVDRAIATAVRGAAHQRQLTGYEREGILRRAGDIADARADDLARTISQETGKPIGEAKGEASRVGDLLRLSAFEGSHLYGDTLPLDAAPNGGTESARVHATTAVRGGRGDHTVQLPGAARRPQARTGAGGGQRGRAEARSSDASDSTDALRDLARGGVAPRSDLVPHRRRKGARRRAVRGSSRSKDQFHRQLGDR